MPYMKKARNPIQSVKTTINILEILKDLEGATLTEVADDLDVTKGAVYNHLTTLAEHGFVVKQGDEYQIGLRFCDFGEHSKHQKKIYSTLKPPVEELAKETEMMVTVMVEENGKGTILYRTHEHSRLSPKTRVGSRVHLHYTALGKTILAYLPRQRVESIISNHGLPKLTENTITEREALYDQLSEIREQGIAFDKEESVRNIRCVAAPIRTHSGDVLGSISVAGVKGRVQGEFYKTELPEKVQDAATLIGINTK
jgi:DNA-binding IclR family transcriptional regulator